MSGADPSAQLLGWPAFVRRAWAIVRARHGCAPAAIGVGLLAFLTLPSFLVLALRDSRAANLASEGLRFLLSTQPGSLVAHSSYHFLLPVDGDRIVALARLTVATLAVGDDLLAGRYATELERGERLEMGNLAHLLGTGRRAHTTGWDETVTTITAAHVVLSHGGRLWKVRVGTPGARIAETELEAAFRFALASTSELGPGRLTHLPQPVWARHRARLESASLAVVETAALFVALDAEAGPEGEPRRDSALGDRWWARSLQVVATATGQLGFVVDHLAADGFEFGRFAERVMLRAAEGGDVEAVATPAPTAAPAPPTGTAPPTAPEPTASPAPEPLRWGTVPGCIDDPDLARCHTARVDVLELTRVDLKAAGVSPDAVAQLVLHRAFYRVTGRLPDGAACVVHQRLFEGGRYSFAHVVSPPGDSWTQGGTGLREAATALRSRVQQQTEAGDLFSTLFAIAGVQTSGPMGLRAWVRRVSDGLTALPALRSLTWPELLGSNLSGLDAAWSITPVIQRPDGLGCVFLVGEHGTTWHLWWKDRDAGDMARLVVALRAAAEEALHALSPDDPAQEAG